MGEPGGLPSTGSHRVRHDCSDAAAAAAAFVGLEPTVVFLPRESMDRAVWGATLHGVSKSQPQLSI